LAEKLSGSSREFPVNTIHLLLRMIDESDNSNAQITDLIRWFDFIEAFRRCLFWLRFLLMFRMYSIGPSLYWNVTYFSRYFPIQILATSINELHRIQSSSYLLQSSIEYSSHSQLFAESRVVVRDGLTIILFETTKVIGISLKGITGRSERCFWTAKTKNLPWIRKYRVSM
jgi:hypothetical protein